VEMYNSGCTQHLTPYKDKIETYRDIPLRHFSAVNQQNFSAIRQGEMVVEVPDGD
ncbi:hypothetical protein IW262DRAFT_1234079, partial [Armillaria fumosa]